MPITLNARITLGQRSAFTLIEIVIAASLMALILVSSYVCLNAAFAGQKVVEPRVEIAQNARVALAIMTSDLRSACSLSKDYDFLGMTRMLGEIQADNLDFATHNYTPRRPGEGDFCQESLYLDKDAETGRLNLYRRRNPAIALDALSGGSREEIADGLLGLKFEYFDGLDWYSSWGEIRGRSREQSSQRERSNLAGLPEAVRITVLFDSNRKTRSFEAAMQATNEPPMVFQSVVRLELAGVSRGSAFGNPPASEQDNAGQPAAGGGF